MEEQDPEAFWSGRITFAQGSSAELDVVEITGDPDLDPTIAQDGRSASIAGQMGSGETVSLWITLKQVTSGGGGFVVTWSTEEP